MKMKGVFVNWTKPFTERKRLRGHGFKIHRDYESNEYTTPDQDLLYTIMSVGYWKKFNGPTKLYTDKVGFDYYRKNNMLKLWDEIDVLKLEKYDKVDAGQFWTSGKSYCIGIEETPFCFMDLDFMVRQKLPDWVFNSDITIPYWEIPRGYYFPTKEQYDEVKHWKPSEDYSYSMMVPNTSFLYINNKEVQSDYLKSHVDSVNTKDEVPEWFWLVSDQGLFGQSLRKIGVNPETLTDKIFVSEFELGGNPVGETPMFVYPLKNDPSKDKINWWHIWFRKINYGYDEELRFQDCKDFYKEISDFLPEFRYVLNNPRLEKYS
jgi:hypothetical protein